MSLAKAIAPGAQMSEPIQSAIRRSEVVGADLTGANPNLVFEVGLALGLSKPVLLLSQGPVKDVPFDRHTHQVAMDRPEDLDTVRQYVEHWLRDARMRRQAAAY